MCTSQKRSFAVRTWPPLQSRGVFNASKLLMETSQIIYVPGSNPPPHDRLEPIQESVVSEQPQKDDINKQEEAKDDGHGEASEPISALQAAWNVTNAIQGMFIVGLPIAVKVSQGEEEKYEK